MFYGNPIKLPASSGRPCAPSCASASPEEEEDVTQITDLTDRCTINRFAYLINAGGAKCVYAAVNYLNISSKSFALSAKSGRAFRGFLCKLRDAQGNWTRRVNRQGE